MKKLMVVLSAALMCSAATAASVLWSGSETFADSEGNEFSESRDITAYLFDASTMTQTALVESWAGGAVDISAAKVTDTWYNAYGLEVTDAIGTSGSKSLFWAVVNGEDLFVSSLMTKDILSVGDTEFDWGTMNESGNVFTGETTFGGAGWYTAGSVPEPTSGLLLLIGVAGLALRRRRA